MSRDQLTPNVAAWGLSNKMVPLFKEVLFHGLFRAFLFTRNTRANWAYPGDSAYTWKLPDITFVGHWAMYYRGLWMLSAYPAIMVCDLDLLVNALIKVYSYGTDQGNTDDINYIASLALSYYRFPTPLSWLARKIYGSRPRAKTPPATSPENAGYAQETNTIQVVLNAYFRYDDPKQGPMLNEWWRPIIKEMFP
jgi:hypothetical protein